MATMTSSTRDIPMHYGRDSFAAAAARSVPGTKAHHPLPTPPNSISPNLPPHGLKAYGTRSAAAHALEHVESDLDLHDGPEDSGHEGDIGQEHDIGSLGSEMTGSITTALLAKHHLPEILLAHGPLAIRHITGYLTTSVPGFASIPPAKARRLVVGALEGRGSGGEAGGVNRDVKFEKVGWGRWDAKQLKGNASGKSRPAQQSPPPSMPSSYSTGMPIAKSNHFSFDRTRLNAPVSSWAGDSVVSRDDIDTMMLENEADKMSLDGDESCSSSEAPPEDEPMGDDPDDLTDDEDWAAVGAAALRAASYSVSGPNRNFLSSHAYSGGSHRSGGPSLSLAKSVPFHQAPQSNNIDFSSLGMTSDSQEREAVEALLRLGSV